MNIYGPTTAVDIADLYDCMNHYKILLPKTYMDFVSRYGSGAYCALIRVKSPEIIRNEREEFLWFMKNEYFSKGDRDGLTLDHVIKGVEIADSIDGDKIICLPNDDQYVYVLPKWKNEYKRLRLSTENGFVGSLESIFQTSKFKYYLTGRKRIMEDCSNINVPKGKIASVLKSAISDIEVVEEFSDDLGDVFFSQGIGGRIITSNNDSDQNTVDEIDVEYAIENSNFAQTALNHLRSL